MYRGPALASALVLLLSSCGSGPRARVASAVDTGDFTTAFDAYDEFRRTEGSDPILLSRVAGVLLREEVEGDDEERRRAALSQLALAGTQGEPILRAIADGAGVTPGRLGALARLARRGREDARLALRALADSDEPSVLAAAIGGMEPEADRGLLLRHIGHDSPEVRAAAASALAGLAGDDDVLEALAAAARMDPVASVRAASVRALGRGGAAAVEPLRERLGDPEASVRLAAVGALFTADRAEARDALVPLLEVAPSPAGVEAARLLAQLEEGEAATRSARDFLERALGADDPALRSMAGVALAGLPLDSASPLDAVRAALAAEPDASVRLSLARALWRRDRDVATAALEALMASEDQMPRVQAATILSAEEHAGAAEVLRDVLADTEAASILRRTAVRALAREAMQPERARAALRDNDALVRIYAAGGILAAAAART